MFSGGKISVPRQDANVSYEIKNGQPVFSLRRSPRKLAPHLVKHFFKSKYGCPFVSNSATFSYGLFQNIQSSQAAHPPLGKASSLSFPPRPTPPCLNTSSYSRETFGSAKTFSTPCFKQNRIWMTQNLRERHGTTTVVILLSVIAAKHWHRTHTHATLKRFSVVWNILPI